MTFELIQIATVCSPFCDLEGMHVQPKGVKETYATIEFKEEYVEGLKDLDGFSQKNLMIDLLKSSYQ